MIAELSGCFPAVTEISGELVEAYATAGLLLEDSDHGLDYLQRAVGLSRELVAAHLGVPSYEDALARSLRRLGTLLDRRGSYSEVMARYGESLELRTALRERFPSAVQHVVELAVLHRAAADHLVRAGDLPGARLRLEQCIGHLGEARALRPTPSMSMLLADTYSSLAEVLDELGLGEPAKQARADGEAWMRHRRRPRYPIPGMPQRSR